MSLSILNYLRLSLLPLIWFLSPESLAAKQGEGIVNMHGAIIETPCAIATGDELQSIIMQALPVSTLERQGKGESQPFTIRLTNCLPNSKNDPITGTRTFRVTFDGIASDSLFDVQGQSSGVALRISDAAGNIAHAGRALPGQIISPGNMQLDYYLTPVRSHQRLAAGSYFTTIRFKMDYF